MVNGVPVAVGGGVEQISLVQPNMNRTHITEESLLERHPDLWMAMIDTADTVAGRYGVTRESQDEYSLQSQLRCAAGQQSGAFDDEIVPFETTMLVTDRETGEVSEKDVVIDRDTCNRPTTTMEGLAGLEPVRGEGKWITAGNASQLSDGASACLVMDSAEAERRNVEPLGIFKGFATAGCEPDEMGIGPVYAIPRLLERKGLKMDDIDLWELNEAFASQVALLPRPARHPERQAECERRLDRHRPPVRHDRLAPGRPCADRGQAPGREECRRDHVHRRRPGRGGPVRGLLTARARKRPGTPAAAWTQPAFSPAMSRARASTTCRRRRSRPSRSSRWIPSAWRRQARAGRLPPSGAAC